MRLRREKWRRDIRKVHRHSESLDGHTSNYPLRQRSETRRNRAGQSPLNPYKNRESLHGGRNPLPAHALAKRSDMRDMVPAMPGVGGEHIVESHGAAFGMKKPAGKIFGFEAPQQDDPALMQSIEESERKLNGRILRIL